MGQQAPFGVLQASLGHRDLAAQVDQPALGALAARMGLGPSTLSRNLNGLVREGFVELASPDDDGRRKLVWLTESGARKLEAAIVLWRAAHDELAKLMDAGSAARLSAATTALDCG